MNLAVLQPLLSRKFLVTMACVALGVLAVNVPGETKLEFLKWVLGIYVVGNVSQKALIQPTTSDNSNETNP